jgi:hypothetical protein
LTAVVAGTTAPFVKGNGEVRNVPEWVWIVIVVAALAALALALWAVAARRRRERLRGQFGPEYDRAVAEHGTRREAEAELARREEKHARLDIVPLAQESRDRYRRSWEELQNRFVDEPSGSLAEADRLVTEVMRERGYPMDEFDQRVADISVDHPDVVEHYRAARAIHDASGDGDASTEDLRQAVVHYRALFAELLETSQTDEEEVPNR